jgi:glutathione synthase/RimK-type ligase-like ATP-grasp enzyme
LEQHHQANCRREKNRHKSKAMDLKVAGVDIIRSSKGPLLLEVNSFQD